jgi:hypothetical protein
MQAAELFALATAHGIDLKRVAGNSSDFDGPAAERKPSREQRSDGIERVPLTVRGAESRVYRRPHWSHAELGIAAAGLSELPWLAARYSYAGDYASYWPLWWALGFNAHRMASREGWAPMVPGRLSPRHERTGKPLPGAKAEPHFYLLDLAQLVLDEDANKRYFSIAPQLYCAYMRVEEPIWERVLEKRFRALQAVYDRWLAVARGMIQRKLMPVNLHHG